MNTMTNSITAKIVDNRYIGKVQLNADDMGGVGCKNWDDYRNVCNALTVAAWNHTMGRENDKQIIGDCIANLFRFFGISVVDTDRYYARILSALVERKAKRSDALKDAIKAKKAAKDAWTLAIAEEAEDAEVAYLKSVYEEHEACVDALYLEPHNYWFDPAPMFDKKKCATAKARKALEDTCADIFTERQFMSADEIAAEAQKLADERKGRKARQKAEAKAKASAEAQA